MIMTDSATELSRIAEILERASEPAFLETTAGQFAVLIFGAFLGMVLTYALALRVRYEETQRTERADMRQREQQRRLLVSLLGDEIALRWNQLVARVFHALFEKFSIDNVQGLCKTRFQPDDLYVFQQCARDISLTTVFDDHAIVSHLIYIHILANDFCDGQKTLRECYNEYERAETPGQSTASDGKGRSRQEIEAILQEIWKDLQAKYQQLDSHLLRIFARIENDYNEYIHTSGFIRESQSATSVVRDRLDAVVARRLPPQNNGPTGAA